MPSTRLLAVALTALVLLAGCSMLPGGGGGSPDAADVGRHEFLFTADTGGEPYEATITVSEDGETVAERTLDSDGNGTYANLTSVSASGPYTVTVNTTLPASGGGNMSDQFTVNGSLGNATVLDLTYFDITTDSFRLPREAVSEPLRFRKTIRMDFPLPVVVKHDGETVYREVISKNGSGIWELGDLPETGVYRVSVEFEHWTNETVVVRDPKSKLFVGFWNGEPRIRVYEPSERAPVA